MDLTWIKKIYWELLSYEWRIGYCEYDLDNYQIILDEIKLFKKPSFKGWYADPVVVDLLNDSIQVLVERYDRRNYGVIDLVEYSLSHDKSLRSSTLLDTGTHLSYPIHKKLSKSKWAIYPESSSSGKFRVYKVDSDKRLLNESVLLESDMGMVDLTPLEISERTFWFGSAKNNDYVVWVMEEIEGELRFHQHIHLDVPEARSAGPFFSKGGTLFRPSQGMHRRYGGEVCIYSVSFKDSLFELKRKYQLTSNNNRYPLGLHTINVTEKMIVLDVLGYKYLLPHLLFRLYNAAIKKK